MISLEQYLGGYDTKYPNECTLDIKRNGQHICDMANWVLKEFGFERGVNSGWRPLSVNGKISNAAPHSKHISGLAIDLSDRDRALAVWCIEHTNFLMALKIYMEDPRWTPTWVHVQSIAPGSGNRIFIPSATNPQDEQVEFFKEFEEKGLLIKL